jgi:cytidylate kinase
MYRAVALAASRLGLDPGDGAGLESLCRGLDIVLATEDGRDVVFLGGEDVTSIIRSPEMDMLSSSISAVREVRTAMTGLQRRLAGAGKGVVAEGRDMGTVVFPDAMHKFFLTAPVLIRAERRHLERLGRGEEVSFQEVEAELRRRDRQDETRPVAPLRPAPDAFVLDTAEMSPEEVVEAIVSRMKSTNTNLGPKNMRG